MPSRPLVLLALLAVLGVVMAAGLVAQLEQRKALDTLRGEVETFERRSNERFEALERRLRALETRRMAGGKPSPPTAPPSPPAPERVRPLAQAGAAVSAGAGRAVTPTARTDAAEGLEAAEEASGQAAEAANGDETETAIEAFDALAARGPMALGALRTSGLGERFRARDEAGLELLDQFLRDPDANRRVLASAILEGLHDRRAVPLLDRALSDDDVLVRRMASHALAVLGDDAAIAPLERALQSDEDLGARANAAYGLAKLGQPGGEEALLEIYRSPQLPPAMRPGILGGMADLGAPAFAPIFLPLLRNPSAEPFVRLLAIEWVRKGRSPEGREALERLVADPSTPESVRAAAQRVLDEPSGGSASSR